MRADSPTESGAAPAHLASERRPAVGRVRGRAGFAWSRRCAGSRPAHWASACQEKRRVACRYATSDTDSLPSLSAGATRMRERRCSSLVMSVFSRPPTSCLRTAFTPSSRAALRCSSQAGVSGDRAETLARRGRRALWRSRGPPPMPVACVSIRRPPAERTNCGAPLERPAGQSKADRLSAFTRRSPAA